MYPTPEFTPAAVITKLMHFITNIFNNTIDLIGGVIAGGIVAGVFVIVIIAVVYVLLSMEGHRLERPEIE